MDLHRLLERAKDGDESAFAALVVATQADIWRFCSHLVGSTEADDITQETYLAAWKGVANFKGDATPRTWLFAIAKRLAAKNERRTHRWRELSTPTPDAFAMTSDPHHALEFDQAMKSLAPERRLALVLTQVFGFSYEEVAVICDCSLGTVRSRVSRGRRDLMALLIEPACSPSTESGRDVG